MPTVITHPRRRLRHFTDFYPLMSGELTLRCNGQKRGAGSRTETAPPGTVVEIWHTHVFETRTVHIVRREGFVGWAWAPDTDLDEIPTEKTIPCTPAEDLSAIAAGRLKTAMAWLLDCESTPQEKIQAATRTLRLFHMDEDLPLAHVAD